MADGLNFFQKLFASILGGGGPEAEKKRLLRSISKDLIRTKYKFYKTSSNEIEPSFPKFFWEIYKIISPAQLMFQNTPPAALKNSVTNYFLTDKQHELLETMTEANIENLTHTMPIAEVNKKMEESLKAFEADFSDGVSECIDKTYSLLMAFKNFCSYDYYFLLRKFDSSLKERNFAAPPRFQVINGTYVVEDLKNFLEVAWGVPFEEDYQNMIFALKAAKGTEPITLANWKKICSRLKLLQNNKVFEMIIQLISEDPGYREKPSFTEEHIVESFIQSVKKTVHEKIGQVQQKEQASKVDSLIEQIFGEHQVEHLKYYNNSQAAQFERKGLGTYSYCDPLSYAKDFLLNYVKTDLRNLSDILLVRGKWTTAQLSSPMSDAYNNLLELSQKIADFDQKLAEDHETGLKLKTLLPRSEHDKVKDKNIVSILLRDINNEAADILIRVSQNLVVYARNLKSLLEDYVKPHPEMIINWKELGKFAEQDIRIMGVTAYKKIYLFTQLLQNFPVAVK